MAKTNSLEIFSKEIKKYVAFGCIELLFDFKKEGELLDNKFYLLHIPIVK